MVSVHKETWPSLGCCCLKMKSNNNSQIWPLIHLTSLATFYSKTLLLNSQNNNIMNMNMNKMANFSLAKIHTLLPFYLILTRGPIIIVKKNLRVILSWRMLLSWRYRWLLGVCSIRVSAKKNGRSLLRIHYRGSWYSS